MPIASDLFYSLHQGDELETPAVVLLHGAGGNHLYWPVEIRRLPHHRVLAVDLPGHGKSEGPGQQSIQAYADNVLEWLFSIDVPKAVFLGHSMGAAIALTLALHQPECVLGLGLLSAGARLPVPAAILDDLVSSTTFHKAIEAIRLLAFSESTDPHLIDLAMIRMAEIRPSVLYNDFLACESFNITEHLSQIRQPALILCGVEDALTPPRSAQLLTGLMPNARLEIIPQAGHMVMLEQPQAVANLLSQFLDSIPYIAG